MVYKRKEALATNCIASDDDKLSQNVAVNICDEGMGIGEVSRAEAEYDFAILLRASKQVEIEGDHTVLPADEQVVGSKINFKQNPQMAKAYLVKRLKEAGLKTKRLRTLDGKQVLLKVKAPQHVLELGAEQMHLKKQRKTDQTWTSFSREFAHVYADYDPSNGIKFIDSERQNIVYHLLSSVHGAGINTASEFSYIVEKMFPLHKDDLVSLKHNWVTFWKAPLPYGRKLHHRTTSSLDPISESYRYCNTIGRLFFNIVDQPIDHVAQYYGEKIAFYFAWLEMYTRWLILPSLAGCVLFVIQITDKSLNQPLAPYYAIFMAFWASLFLIAWKRNAAVLAYRWGVLGFEEEETTRADFRGDPRISTETLKRYPFWKRWLKFGVTWAIVTICLTLVIAFMYILFQTKDKLERESINDKKAAVLLDLDDVSFSTLGKWAKLADWDFWFYLLITPFMYGLMIPVLDVIYTKMAVKLNWWENHKTDSNYQTHLILKVFSFRFVHVFASLYYYAFASNANLLKVAIQLAAFLVAGQSWHRFTETGLPYMKQKLCIWHHRRSALQQIQKSSIFQGTSSNAISSSNGYYAGKGENEYSVLKKARVAEDSVQHNENINNKIQEQCRRLEQATAKAWEESRLETYDTFSDYTEMLIQFGYVSFFSIAFPLSPALAMLNNIIKLRTDAFKLCSTKQRPLAAKASGIGVWFSVLQMMSVMAVITNCIHISFTTTQIESQVFRFFGIALTPSGKVWVLFLAEHLILIVKIWLAFVIPCMPYEVKQKLRAEMEHTKSESAKAIAKSLAMEKHSRENVPRL